MTKGMATMLYNRISAHYSPEFAYQSEILPDEEPNEEQKKLVDRWYTECINKLDAKKRARTQPASSSEDEESSTTSETPSKKMRVE
jgi:hypothetical protein